MSNQFRKYSALFLLLLFLIPTVTEFVHNFIHKDDVHCTQTGLHFHQTEHHCAIDDFVPFVSDLPSFQQFVIFAPKFKSRLVPIYYRTPYFSETNKYYFSLRGPPTVV